MYFGQEICKAEALEGPTIYTAWDMLIGSGLPAENSYKAWTINMDDEPYFL